MPIGGSFEAREAHVADVILRNHEWILPLRNGLIPSKPPLFHWLVALMSAPWGAVYEFTTRLPSVLGAALMVLVTGYVARDYSSSAGSNGKQQSISLTAAGILSLTYGFQVLAINAMVDMLFVSLTMTAALLFLRKAFQGSIESLDYFLFWMLCALAVLAKGPLGFILPCLICISALVPARGILASFFIVLKPHIGWIAAFLLAGS